MSRPQDFLKWANDTFGEIALDPKERTLRFLEEAIELAQVMEVDLSTVSALTERVYGRISGNKAREIGQCLATLELLALVVGVDADYEASAEFRRVRFISKDEWVDRHDKKVELGIARWEKTDELA